MQISVHFQAKLLQTRGNFSAGLKAAIYFLRVTQLPHYNRTDLVCGLSTCDRTTWLHHFRRHEHAEPLILSTTPYLLSKRAFFTESSGMKHRIRLHWIKPISCHLASSSRDMPSLLYSGIAYNSSIHMYRKFSRCDCP